MPAIRLDDNLVALLCLAEPAAILKRNRLSKRLWRTDDFAISERRWPTHA